MEARAGRTDRVRLDGKMRNNVPTALVLQPAGNRVASVRACGEGGFDREGDAAAWVAQCLLHEWTKWRWCQQQPTVAASSVGSIISKASSVISKASSEGSMHLCLHALRRAEVDCDGPCLAKAIV